MLCQKNKKQHQNLSALKSLHQILKQLKLKQYLLCKILQVKNQIEKLSILKNKDKVKKNKLLLQLLVIEPLVQCQKRTLLMHLKTIKN